MNEPSPKSNTPWAAPPPLTARKGSANVVPTPLPNGRPQVPSAVLQGNSPPRSADPRSLGVESESKQPLETWLSRFFLNTPTWLLSLLLHISIILLLALIPLQKEMQNSLSLILGIEGNGEGDAELLSFDMDSWSNGMETADEVDRDFSKLDADLESGLKDLSNFNPNPEISPVTLKVGLSSRTGLMKDALLKAYGGTAETERAVALGLDWLKRQQDRNDGSWSLVSPYRDGGVNENRTAATAMALLAFMGAGHTHREGQFQSNVERGLQYLLNIQDEDGFFAAKATGIQRTYAQAQASIAICELYGMTNDENLRVPAERAVRWAIEAQSDSGGWRYQPRQDSDTSVTGWYVMALVSARMAGLDVDSEALDRVHTFLDSVQRVSGSIQPNPQGDRYAYIPSSKDKDAMTAEGILCRMYLGWSTTDPRIFQGCKYLAGRSILSDLKQRNFYYWYYATNALHHAGGQAWFEWNRAMREVLPAMQIQSGGERGSWSPQGDPHGDAGGRLYSTVFAILCLEAYYRHMPLSEMASRP
jgi:hypothetical protein